MTASVSAHIFFINARLGFPPYRQSLWKGNLSAGMLERGYFTWAKLGELSV